MPHDPELHSLDAFEPRGATRVLLDDVDQAIREIDEHRPLRPEISERLLEDLLIDRVHSSAFLEGSRLSRRETIAALQVGVIEAGTEKDEADVVRLGNAMLRLDELLGNGAELDEGALRALHERITEGDARCLPGQYRREDVKIAGAATRPPSWAVLPDLMSIVAQTVRENVEEMHPLVVGRGCIGLSHAFIPSKTATAVLRG